MKKTILFILILSAITAHSQPEMCEVKFAESTDSLSLLNQQTLVSECQTIRVVFHVVYDPLSDFGSGEISENQVRSQVRAANQFFRNDSLYQDDMNAGLGYTVRIAETDVTGAPTSGIVYHDGVALFGEIYHTHGLRNNSLEGVSAGTMADELAWGADMNGKKYLNCYVVNRIDGSSGGGVQAYAYFPTINNVYGNYNLYNTVGSKYFEEEYGESFALKTYTNTGKVWAHELLHNFGLFHTFHGDSCDDETNCNIQGDRICDTEPQTRGISCSGSCGFVSNNIMDYLSEGCKVLITDGQAARAHLAIQNSLEDYLVCSDCELSQDFNGDGGVNIQDVSLLGSAFGCQEGDECYSEIYDLNCDGQVNVLDASLLNFSFNQLSIEDMEALDLTVVDITGRQITPNQITTPGIYILCMDGLCHREIITQEWPRK